MTILTFGHQNPDTDTITSALVMADLQKALGKDIEAVRLGDINGETEYALNKFGVEAPRLIKSLDKEEVILVDHNEFQQSAPGIEEATILMVVDHHRIANFETAGPLYYRAEPVGCTATILRKMYKESDVEIKPEIAGLMLSAIISDTLLFKSPTCTDEDVKAAEALAEIANIDLQSYGLEMLKAGASTKDKTAEELLNIDAKSFAMGGHEVRVAQVNTVDIDEVLARQDELEQAINAETAQEGYALFVLVVTDILNSNSKILALGQQQPAVEKAFNVALDQNTALLEGVVSRKKQVVPQLTAALTE
ncbi:manganese-dependent inorganic pyrophosphatase [Macrococcoides caseolyticum]|uniref:Probable manganese-dependent inorganic pyrophosphatase n=1 Tax=Macrococcus caseolyticus (strain JCSC5402) TaxID=458233 RepID=B9E843_MACCJ|nr:manganese-dependent inorganic pyrophosphatase [Macrococcus caseolyticus]ARQ05267.1 putative manganese-dependent inorganic pyrophosphatase [Macrococcus caseolyticus]PKD99061.1 manganese-dependent inorganic pyrophosphatase [Macrococcus caseolyticus]PKE06349.1 manganese-dependent inorganic pyrophosphatase [Macrococcus caseolyticus]PKE23509.1 manganese-dependent inorganic pyrophosphatase [Macrococcus caseolyticus]PKE52837.1 manganese-dependent inorganic pyrophosphatase [Macrococcus caseolyticus